MAIIDLANNDDASILPPIYIAPFPPFKCHCPLNIFFQQWWGVGCMRVGCCIMGAWFVKGVASRGGRDKPQNNNGWHEPEFELWTSPAMEAVCSSVTPSPLLLQWLCERDGTRNSQGTVRVGSQPPKPQMLVILVGIFFFFFNFERHSLCSPNCWPWTMLTNKAKIILQVVPNTFNQIL